MAALMGPHDGWHQAKIDESIVDIAGSCPSGRSCALGCVDWALLMRGLLLGQKQGHLCNSLGQTCAVSFHDQHVEAHAVDNF